VLYCVSLSAYFCKLKLCNMGVWRQLAEYLYIKKKDPNAPSSQWIKYMHGINRISVFMFLFALVFMLVRKLIIPLFIHH